MKKTMLKKIEEVIIDKTLDDDMKLMLISTFIKAISKSERKRK